MRKHAHRKCRPLRVLIIAAGFILCFSITPALALDLSPVPTDSWVYGTLDWVFLNPPPDDDFKISSRPYRRSDIEQLLSLYNSQEIQNEAVKWQIENTRKDFDKKSLYDSQSGSDLEIRFKSTPYYIHESADSMQPLHRVGLKQEFAATYRNSFTVMLRGRIDNKGDRESSFKGRRWDDKLVGWFDYAMMAYRTKAITISYGRSFRVYGPGDFDRLLISDNSPPFDQFHASFDYKRFRFEYLHTKLNDYYSSTDSTVTRYFAGHRIVFKPKYNIEIGLSETSLYGNTEGDSETRYLIPIVPFYWEQWNNRENDNIYMGIDFIWWPFENTRLYGELMIDDFQIDFVSEPQQMGFDIGISRLGIAGVEKLRADIQYTQIRNWVYGQVDPTNAYFNSGTIIGSSLGPDADRLRYSASYAMSRTFVFTSGGEYSRKGEGEAVSAQPSPVPDDNKFPTGEVYRKWSNYIQAEIITGSLLNATVKAGYYNIENPRPANLETESFYINILVAYEFQRWMNL